MTDMGFETEFLYLPVISRAVLHFRREFRFLSVQNVEIRSSLLALLSKQFGEEKITVTSH